MKRREVVLDVGGDFAPLFVRSITGDVMHLGIQGENGDQIRAGGLAIAIRKRDGVLQVYPYAKNCQKMTAAARMESTHFMFDVWGNLVLRIGNAFYRMDAADEYEQMTFLAMSNCETFCPLVHTQERGVMVRHGKDFRMVLHDRTTSVRTTSRLIGSHICEDWSCTRNGILLMFANTTLPYHQYSIAFAPFKSFNEPQLLYPIELFASLNIEASVKPYVHVWGTLVRDPYNKSVGYLAKKQKDKVASFTRIDIPLWEHAIATKYGLVFQTSDKQLHLLVIRS